MKMKFPAGDLVEETEVHMEESANFQMLCVKSWVVEKAWTFSMTKTQQGCVSFAIVLGRLL